jgi:hypothetical protein
LYIYETEQHPVEKIRDLELAFHKRWQQHFAIDAEGMNNLNEALMILTNGFTTISIEHTKKEGTSVLRAAELHTTVPGSLRIHAGSKSSYEDALIIYNAMKKEGLETTVEQSTWHERIKVTHALSLGINPKRCRCYITTVYGETRSDDEFIEKQTIRRGNMKIVDASGSAASSSSKRKEEEVVAEDRKATKNYDKKRRKSDA